MGEGCMRHRPSYLRRAELHHRPPVATVHMHHRTVLPNDWKQLVDDSVCPGAGRTAGDRVRLRATGRPRLRQVRAGGHACARIIGIAAPLPRHTIYK